MKELKRYLDGPKFVNWLVSEEGIVIEKLSYDRRKQISKWTQGHQRADIYRGAADLLLEIGLHERWIPDECWAENQAPNPGNKTLNGHGERTAQAVV